MYAADPEAGRRYQRLAGSTTALVRAAQHGLCGDAAVDSPGVAEGLALAGRRAAASATASCRSVATSTPSSPPSRSTGPLVRRRATTRMPKGSDRLATSRPMLPSPKITIVDRLRPWIRAGVSNQLPVGSDTHTSGMPLARASTWAITHSLSGTALAPRAHVRIWSGPTA